MEQKKILWVILSVSLFVLIIFGAALLLYSPSHDSAAVGGEMIPYERPTAARVDPDAWARDPDKVAVLDKTAPTAQGNIINLNNVNILSTDGQSGQTNGIDVSDLTAQAGAEVASGLPKELAEQIGIDAGAEQKREEPTVGMQKKEEPVVHMQARATIGTVQQKATVQIQRPKTEQKATQSAAAGNATVKAFKKNAGSKIRTLYWVQTASLANRINAERARDTLAVQHMRVEIFTKNSASGLTHRVRVGPFSNTTEAHYWLNNIKKIRGFEKSYVAEEKVTVKD